VSALRFRPDLRLPWQALALFAAALYVIESGLRGWDFRPTVLDLVVFGGLTALLVLRLLVARGRGDDED
jgi:hypothetical protein